MEKMTNTAMAQEAWQGLHGFYMAKGDRWTAESLQLAAARCVPVPSLTRAARERLREPLAVVLYDAEWQTLQLFGEKLAAACTSILGQEPQEATAALGDLIVGYTSRAAANIGLGYAHWKWDGKAPWEQ